MITPFLELLESGELYTIENISQRKKYKINNIISFLFFLSLCLSPYVCVGADVSREHSLICHINEPTDIRNLAGGDKDREPAIKIKTWLARNTCSCTS